MNKWKYVSSSVPGTSHDIENRPCEDDNIVINMKEVLIAIVADGAGSATNGIKGAALSCKIGVRSILKSLSKEKELNKDDVDMWIKNIREEINVEAKKTKQDFSNFACTIMGAVINKENALFFHIGDGAIVTVENGVHKYVFWPKQGMYANQTYFITEDNYYANLQIEKREATIDEVYLFSDGLQSLILSYHDKAVHNPPFAEPMLDVLRARKNNNLDDLESSLTKILNSPSINERTTDDKTLILATRIYK